MFQKTATDYFVRLDLTYFLMGFQSPTLIFGHRDGTESVPPRSFYPLVLLFLSFPPSLVYFGRPPETKANKTRRKTRPRRRKRGQKDRDEERAEGRRTLT